MRRDLVTSALAVVACTLALGLGYPLVIAGVAQVAFPHEADGSPALGPRARRSSARSSSTR